MQLTNTASRIKFMGNVRRTSGQQASTINTTNVRTLLMKRKDYIMVYEIINPLPDDKILDWSKLKQIADNI